MDAAFIRRPKFKKKLTKSGLKLATDVEFQKDAKDKGVDLSNIDLTGSSPISIRPGASGLGVTETIVVGIAVGVSVQAIAGLWRRFVWPEIERRLGVDAIGPEKEG